jgi:hypothetical protein
MATVVIAAALVWCAPAHAIQRVGAVAALEGEAHARRVDGSEWAALAPGDDVFLGDRLRTQAASKLKLLFSDDSVLTLAANTELTVDEQVVPEEEATESYFSLMVGTVRALVSERYGAPGATFEMETPTAVAGVRGTRFIAKHDEEAEETTVLGLSNITVVRSKDDPEGEYAVEVREGQVTRVTHGRSPHAPVRAPDDVLRSLSAATLVSAVGGGGGGPRSGRSRSGSAPRSRAAAQSQGVDQPVQQLREIQGATVGRPKPPPPPIPR